MKRFFSLVAIIAALPAFILTSCTKKPSATKEVLITHAVRLKVAKDKSFRTPSEKKMQSSVLELYKQYQANGGSFTIPDAVADNDFLLQPSYAKVNDSDQVLLYVYMKNTGAPPTIND